MNVNASTTEKHGRSIAPAHNCCNSNTFTISSIAASLLQSSCMMIDDPSMAVLLWFGFLLGVRHACDADHVVAVTSILDRTRGLGAALRVGALWGLGHTVTLIGVGVA